MKTKVYEQPECRVYALVAEQPMLADSFGENNYAGPEMGNDKFLEDF